MKIYSDDSKIVLRLHITVIATAAMGNNKIIITIAQIKTMTASASHSSRMNKSKTRQDKTKQNTKLTADAFTNGLLLLSMYVANLFFGGLEKRNLFISITSE